METQPNRSPVIRRVALSDIRLDGGTLLRAKLNQEVIRQYAEAKEEGATLPPPVLFFDGTDNWLADGAHRVKADEQLGFLEMDCEVHRGSLQDALWYAISANAVHGLRRNRADIRLAIKAALSHPNLKDDSDRGIGRLVGADGKTVASVRRELESENGVATGDDDGHRAAEIPQSGESEQPDRGADEVGAAEIPQSGEPAQTGSSQGETDTAEIPQFNCDISDDMDEIGEGAAEIPQSSMAVDESLALPFIAPRATSGVTMESIQAEFDAQRNKLSSIKSWMTRTIGGPFSEVLGGAQTRIVTDIDNADRELRFARPYAECCYCHNAAPKVLSCNACKGLGWITEQVFKQAPGEMKHDKIAG